MARVHIFGNSVGYGLCGGSENWSHLLKLGAYERQETGVRPRVSVLNLCSPGVMLTHILKSELLPASVNCNRRGRQIGVFCVGTCESSILRSLGHSEPRRSPEEFGNDLASLTDIAESSDVEMIFMGATPVDDKKTFRTPEGDEFCDEGIKKYDALVSQHARATGACYIDLRTSFESDAMLAHDGLHPNEKGNRLMYERVWPVILDHLV